MRGFVITTCLFIILILCIVLNYNFVREVHSEMHGLANNIAPNKQAENKKIIEELYKYWDENNTLLRTPLNSFAFVLRPFTKSCFFSPAL